MTFDHLDGVSRALCAESFCIFHKEHDHHIVEFKLVACSLKFSMTASSWLNKFEFHCILHAPCNGFDKRLGNIFLRFLKRRAESQG